MKKEIETRVENSLTETSVYVSLGRVNSITVSINGEVLIRPMMYLALSYDHRLLDGKEAVTFLVSIKEQLESPERLLLNL